MSNHFQQELAFLGIDSPPAYVRSPEGNGCAESFIRTLSAHGSFVSISRSLTGARAAHLTVNRHRGSDVERGHCHGGGKAGRVGLF
jgi:putative transposase